MADVTSSIVCAALNEKRSRSVFGGTVGVRIGKTLIPSVFSAADSVKVSLEFPTINGCIAVVEQGELLMLDSPLFIAFASA